MIRFVRTAVFAGVFAVMICGGPSCMPDHEPVFTQEGLLEARAEHLKRTVITPHLETRLDAGRNVLWCGTFQLAWNECCTLIDEDVHFETDPPMVAVLNKKVFTRKDLDDSSYVALAGFVGKGIHQRIRTELRKKFKGRARPKYLPSGILTPRPQDIAAYAYLFKELQFATPFERLDEPIVFDGVKLPCFGMEGFKFEHVAMYPQVGILDYRDADDFVIELKTKSKGDRLILAKIRPQPTLRRTIDGLDRRIAAGTRTEMTPGDVLKVPKLNLDLTRSYHELLGRRLVVKNPKIAKDLLVLQADQNIRFQMDEKGVRLRSEASMSFGCGAASPPPQPQHVMIFDKPFLILLRRTDAKMPYFALWVHDPELLVHAD
ncbi:hypothetical protein LCGC14_1053850 [marine sediment metagenome]|uniref:Serpin domain-containing protein n=1 Tax=marine sediment metagenome TaxID=412755 RepID=A0A0F9QU23_9ZZZZ